MKTVIAGAAGIILGLLLILSAFIMIRPVKKDQEEFREVREIEYAKIDTSMPYKIGELDSYLFFVEIDGCEYLILQTAITHKGNCRNHGN